MAMTALWLVILAGVLCVDVALALFIIRGERKDK